MLTDITKLRTICYALDNEELVDEFRRYAIREYLARDKYDAYDEHYIECGRRYDVLRDEIIRRFVKKAERENEKQ